MLNGIRAGAGSSDILTNWWGKCDTRHTFIGVFFSTAFCHLWPIGRQAFSGQTCYTEELIIRQAHIKQ
jgi:hypothetical protein